MEKCNVGLGSVVLMHTRYTLYIKFMTLFCLLFFEDWWSVCTHIIISNCRNPSGTEVTTSLTACLMDVEGSWLKGWPHVPSQVQPVWETTTARTDFSGGI